MKILLLQVPLKREGIKTPSLTSVLRIPTLVPIQSPTKMLRDTNNFQEPTKAPMTECATTENTGFRALEIRNHYLVTAQLSQWKQ